MNKRTAAVALFAALALEGCGGGHSDPQAAERHVCGYIVDDMTSSVRGGTVSFTSGDQTGAATTYSAGAAQMRRDIATLPDGDRLRTDGEQVAARLGAVSQAIKSNGDIIGAAKDLDASTQQLQTLCRAVEP